MSQKDLRKLFLEYFKKNGHTVVPSDSLIPSSDPTLLFTSAGMVQFKSHFLQQIPLTFTRAASSQRCLRTTDIEKVGVTPRHLTFFEMLGNFSFGDYFKKDAIAWGWEFLTKEVGLPAERLWVTVYKDDDETFDIWKKIVPETKIKRMGDETNFWNMGPTGPCGPCSEIFWDFKNGPSKGPDETDRWMEVWNLVFTQFDRQPDGKLNPLPKKNIDTGMGLERLTSVVEGVGTNFDTSLFKPLISFAEQSCGQKYGPDKRINTSLRVIADHLRAITFLVFDGILPSNEGRGYVLRRLLRRALRQGSQFGLNQPFLFKGVPIMTDLMKDTAQDLVDRRESIAVIIKQEEERFLDTIASGSERLNDLIDKTKAAKGRRIPGYDVFRLYDTYGFPPELTKEILAESGLTYDEKGFDKAKDEAQKLAREGWKGSGAKDVTLYKEILKKTGVSHFTGYETLHNTSVIKEIVKDGKSVSELKPGETGEIITAETSFYPEGGGQVGDIGLIKSKEEEILAIVTDTQKPVNDLVVHIVEAKKNLKVGETITLEVAKDTREATMRHHTATHLLHAALRSVLGKSATQAGSLVNPEKLRFDFAYNKALTPQQILEIENIVNTAVLKNMKVTPVVTTPDVARKMGTMALFGEKYGDKVRCLIISEVSPEDPTAAFSLELCGGTHCHASGDIGAFKILSDESVAAGVRRIEAVAGLKAIAHFREVEKNLLNAAEILKSAPADTPGRIQKLLDNQKKMEQEISQLKLKMAQGGGTAGSAAASDIQTVNGVQLMIKVVDGLGPNDLRTLADRLKQQIKSGVIFVASTLVDEGREKVSFVFALTPDVIAKGLSAGALAKTVATEIGGSGGGRPDFAQGGGTSKNKLQSVLGKIPGFLKIPIS